MAQPRRKRRRPKARPLPAEASYSCDSCGEAIVIPVDASQGQVQDFVEDCPVCCRPNRIHVEMEADGTVRAWAERE